MATRRSIIGRLSWVGLSPGAMRKQWPHIQGGVGGGRGVAGVCGGVRGGGGLERGMGVRAGRGKGGRVKEGRGG